jgi:hypothetical protein
LIDDYQISYLGAGRDVLRFGAALSGQPSAALVAADPDFDLRRRASLPAEAEDGLLTSSLPEGDVSGLDLLATELVATVGLRDGPRAKCARARA